MNNIKFDFRLNFGTAGGGSITLNVPRADDLATVNQINNAMNEIIAADVITSATGAPRDRRSAELIKTETRDFVI